MASRESILAQEQSVLHKIRTGNETQGSLVLTNSRLIFVAAVEEEKFFDMLEGVETIRLADVEKLDSIGMNPTNLSIPLDSITSVKGSGGFMTNPNLKVWHDTGSEEKEAEFIQTITGGRKKNLNDWAPVIEKLKLGKISIKIPSSVPDKNSLEGRIVEVLSDLQEKGIFEIESEIEKKYKIDLDPDQVEETCNNLVSKGILEKKSEDFYRLPSPLGADDLSS